MENSLLREQVSALLRATTNAIKVIEYSALYVPNGSPNHTTLMGLDEVKNSLRDLLNEIPED